MIYNKQLYKYKGFFIVQSSSTSILNKVTKLNLTLSGINAYAYIFKNAQIELTTKEVDLGLNTTSPILQINFTDP